VPEGLWSKCPSCEAVLYFTDLENNLHVCPKCSFHNRLTARQRLDLFLDPEGRAELAAKCIRSTRSSSRTARSTPTG
jgi:acetyl-CoA carboxylase carboxyl transferase subunit beta